MLYSKKIKQAMKIAYKAHDGQYDKNGYPYIHHPFHLAEQMETEEEIIVALLHDVIEDSKISIKELKEAGFSKEVITAIELLTKPSDANYFNYIRKISTNELAKKVKLADLLHNRDLSRFDKVTEKEWERNKKYQRAYNLLRWGDEPEAEV